MMCCVDSESKNADENEENYKHNGNCDVLFGHADGIRGRRTSVEGNKVRDRVWLMSRRCRRC